MENLNALFYPSTVPFDSLYIPYIYKEIYLEGIYVDSMNGKKDLTILDVGANIGVVTQYLRTYAKDLYAMEPSTEHFNALKQNVEFNKWTNVHPFKLAMSDRNGEMTLNLAENNRTCHSLVNNYGYKGETVQTVTFKKFMEDNKINQIDFAKIDVEGAEDMVFRHEDFISVCDRVKSMLVEFHYPTYPQLIEHLIKLGYTARRYATSAIVVLFSRS